MISSDLTLDKHISGVCASCFYRLHQLRQVTRSVHTEAVIVLVHILVTSRLDYCNVMLSAALKSVTDKLQRVLNAAAWLISGTWKYDRGISD